MKIEIETDGEELVPANPRPAPTDFTSRAIRLRLMMLFGMLILVVILMKEAGKPENWRWMGFDKQTVVQAEGAVAQAKGAVAQAKGERADWKQDQSIQEPPFDGRLPSGIAGDAVQARSTNDVGAATDAESNMQPSELRPSEASNAIVKQVGGYPVAAVEFWNGFVPRLNAQQQRDLFRLLKEFREVSSSKRHELVDDPKIADYRKLVGSISARRNQFHSEMFDQLAVLADGSEGKEKLAKEFFDSQQVWNKKILPAFKLGLEGEDFSISQLKQIEQLQLVLDPIVLAEVKDRTSIGWEGDSTAWLRLWEMTQNEELGLPIPVTHLQLLSQSEFYRGKAVEISGWARSARRKNLQDSELGVSHYYEIWVRPADTNLAPYNVYSMELPENFPELTDQFQTINVRIKVAGAFFKVRTFIDGAVEVAESPVILAKSFESFNDTSPIAASAWQPSRTTIIVLLVLMPIVATALAWLAHRGTQTQTYQPGAMSTKKINSSLAQLANDPDVKTAHERVLELYQADDHG